VIEKENPRRMPYIRCLKFAGEGYLIQVGKFTAGNQLDMNVVAVM
jgi:hypothetical protein